MERNHGYLVGQRVKDGGETASGDAVHKCGHADYRNSSGPNYPIPREYKYLNSSKRS